MPAGGELQGRSAIVTGGSRGIGFAVARALVTAGATVTITARNSDAGKAAAASLGDGTRYVRADQGLDADWGPVIEAAGERLDILVLNAGISPPAPIASTSLDAFREVCRTNLKGAFLGLQRGVAAMRRHGEGGAVALMASIVGKVGVPGQPAYAASKGGLRLMAKAAALELGPEKIRVNSLHPGIIRTAMTAGYDERSVGAMVPLGRFGDSDEIARAVLYLVSDRGRFVTGAELVVDGGWIAR